MPASIYDIAQAAGVSAATVSNVLNDRGRFSEKTRELVMRVADELGYMPNLAARGLRERRSNTIGIVTPDVSNDYFSRMVLSIERSMHERGYTSFICNTWYRDAENADYLAELKQRSTDGIFFVGSEHWGDLSLLCDIPCAFADFAYSERPSRYTIACNDFATMVRDQTELLIKRGCKRPALLMFERTDSPCEENVSLLSFKRCLDDRDIEYDDSMFLQVSHKKSSQEAARDRIELALESGLDFDGVACIGDRIALGCCEALQDHGLVPGEDVKVIGLDNSLYSRLANPGISTIERNTESMTRFAVDTMLQMLAGNDPAEREVVIPHRIIERASTLGTQAKRCERSK